MVQARKVCDPPSHDGIPFANRQLLPRCSQVHAKKSADVLRKEHEGFKKRVARALKLEKSKASLPGGIANTKDELDRQIAEVQTGTQSSGPLSIEGVETATSAHNAYQQERLAGGKKVANAFQRKLNDFAQFISAFDGLMETIASAGSPYGEIGYQTLSILLIVSSHSLSRLLLRSFLGGLTPSFAGGGEQDKERHPDCGASCRHSEIVPEVRCLARHLPERHHATTSRRRVPPDPRVLEGGC